MANSLKLFTDSDVIGNQEVLDFITDFCWRLPEVPGPFKNECSYWFAVILETAFDRGSVMYDGVSHRYCWRDDDGKQYDIRGLVEGDSVWVTATRFIAWGICDVLEFIDKFVSLAPEIMVEVFSNGYCWYFAHILKRHFERGEVCIAAPLGHMVWVDDDDTPYDIWGVNCSECDYYIPERYLGDCLEDFMHIRSKINFATEADIERIIADYKAATGRTGEEVTDFIAAFLGGRAERVDCLTNVYTKGYCYYFAHMLQLAFGRGQVCFLVNMPHVVWKDTDGRIYDVSGELTHPLGPMIEEEQAPQMAQVYKKLPTHSAPYKWENVKKLLVARLALVEEKKANESG